MKPWQPLLQNWLWRLKGITVYALIGRSGTGKSFRAKLVAQKFNIPLIVDDGLLIRDERILAGRSAKRETNYVSAVKTAVFEDPEHQKDVLTCLEQEKFRKILLLGTSEKMVRRMAERLNLPPIEKYLRIEDIATREEIDLAQKSRKEGNHVIPVPAVEVSKDMAPLLLDAVKVFFSQGFWRFWKPKEFEKSVVRPHFSNRGRVTISESALTQMILHCVDEFDNQLRIRKVKVRETKNGYQISVFLQTNYGHQLSGRLHQLQSYILENIEKYTGLQLEEVNIHISQVRY